MIFSRNFNSFIQKTLKSMKKHFNFVIITLIDSTFLKYVYIFFVK